MRDTSTTPRAGRREWIGLAVLALPTLLVSLDMGALQLALPRLSADLHTTTTQQLWVSDIYGFMIAGFLITMGKLGDRIGRRRLILIGAAVFGVVSVVAAYSAGAEMLIISRGLLGIAGATLMPSILALINSMFADAKQRGTAIALWATCQFSGAALGPVLGGLLLESFWWGSIFLLGVPVMLLLLVVGPILLPETHNPNPGHLEPISVVLSLGSVLAIVYGLKELVVGTSHSVVPLLAILVAAVLGVLFVRRQLNLDDPLLDLRLFKKPIIRTLLITMLLSGAAMNGNGFLVNQYMQSVLGNSPAETALLFAPMGLALAISSMLTPMLANRIAPGTAIAAGMALTTIGFVLVPLTSSTGGVAFAILGISVMALGDGPLVALGTGIVVGSVPPERAGSAASISETSLHIGATLGLAVFGTIGAGVYRGQMEDVTVAGAQDPNAQSTVAGATDVATHLEPGTAEELLRIARDAFTSGMHVASWAGAAVLLGLTVLCWVQLHKRTDATPAAPQLSAEQS
jgi:MFS transporter, DHA2 family, multidrug resistance protein